MHPETLLPQPVLLNAALYAAVALVYSAALFIIDHTKAGSFVFKSGSRLRDPFGYVAICSWPVLLFGGLILVAVRVGANVSKSTRRRRSSRNNSRSRSASASRSRSHTPNVAKPRVTSNNMPRSSSAPPNITPPEAVATFQLNKAPAGYRQSVPSVLPPSTLSPFADDKGDVKRRHYSDYSRMLPLGTDIRTAPLGGGRDAAAGVGGRMVPNRSGRSAETLSRRSTKRSKASSRGVPRGYVSVTRSQKAYAAVGFFWVCIGLAATSCLAGVVFAGQRERLLHDARALNDNLGVADWLILIFTGLIFIVVFAVLAVATAIKTVSTIRPTPQALEMRTVSLDDEENGEGRGIPPVDVSDPVFGTHAAYMAFSSLDAAGNVVVLEDVEDDEERVLESKRRESALLGLVDNSDTSDDNSEDSTDDENDGRIKQREISDEEAKLKMRRDIVDGRPLERFSMPGYNDSHPAPLSFPIPKASTMPAAGMDRQAETSGALMGIVENEDVRDNYALPMEDWRSFYRRGVHLPYQPDEETVERMMRQLRDMGFRNAHENIAALQASSFDLEIASDKLANARM